MTMTPAEAEQTLADEGMTDAPDPAFDRLLHFLFTTAVEGGVNYWASCSAYHLWNEGNCDLGEDLLGFRVDLHDDEAGGDFHVNRRIMARGWRLAVGEYADKISWSTDKPHHTPDHNGLPEWDFDASDADCIVQLGLFGDVRYG